MKFGISTFVTDEGIRPTTLARALEERGFDALFLAEHSHIPVPRKTPAPGGGELHKRYYDVMDPFVTLTAAACATKTLKVATGIALVIQRDTIQTAKLVASIDQVSGGRFVFGIGGGWNQEEIENHGAVFATRMQKMREQIEAMKHAGMPLSQECHATYTEVTPMKRLSYVHSTDFIPGIEPYEVMHLIELFPSDDGVRMTLSFDAMHDEQWTGMAVQGWGEELEKLIGEFELTIGVDAFLNEFERHQAVRQIIVANPNITVEELNNRIYAELFGTPASDPWLGMATRGAFTALPGDGVTAAPPRATL